MPEPATQDVASVQQFESNATPVSYTHLDVYKRQVTASGVVGAYTSSQFEVNEILYKWCK